MENFLNGTGDLFSFVSGVLASKALVIGLGVVLALVLAAVIGYSIAWAVIKWGNIK